MGHSSCVTAEPCAAGTIVSGPLPVALNDRLLLVVPAPACFCSPCRLGSDPAGAIDGTAAALPCASVPQAALLRGALPLASLPPLA